ncbi:MAG: MFS transporter [Microbacterium sp.]|nr:MFS transporter [Microbacterium sp.]
MKPSSRVPAPVLTPLRLRLLLVSLLSVSFLGALDNTVVSTSLATIAGQLGALEHMSWIVVGYTLSSTVLLPVLGKLGDVVGPRSVFLASLVLFLVASLACGFAPDMGWLIAARVVQGMSSAGLQLMSQTIVARVTSPRQRPRSLAIIGTAFPIAILIGPVLGGLITDYWGWPWIFWINLPVGVVALTFALIAVPHLAPGERPSLDIPGTVTLTVGLVALVLAVTWIGEESSRAAALACFLVAAIALAAFFAVEVRASAPILPLRLFADRAFAAGTVLSAIIGIGLFSVTSFLPTYIQMAYRATATVSGLVPIATVFGMLFANLATGSLVGRSGRYRLYPILGTSLGALGLLGMALLPVGLPLAAPMAIMFVVAVGTGCFMSLVVAIVQSAAPPSQTGTATATVNLVRQIGSTVATAVIGGVIAVGVAAALPRGLDAATLTPQLVHAADPATQAAVAAIYRDVFTPIFLALAAVYAVGIVAALLLPRGRLSDDHEPAPATEPIAA